MNVRELHSLLAAHIASGHGDEPIYLGLYDGTLDTRAVTDRENWLLDEAEMTPVEEAGPPCGFMTLRASPELETSAPSGKP